MTHVDDLEAIKDLCLEIVKRMRVQLNHKTRPRVELSQERSKDIEHVSVEDDLRRPGANSFLTKLDARESDRQYQENDTDKPINEQQQ